MADRETPGATAPDEGERAPDGGGVPAGSAWQPSAAAPSPQRVPAQPMAPTEPKKAPAYVDEGPRHAFERWAEKLGVVVDARGRATGVANGKALKGVKSPTRLAASVNAARALHSIPIGRLMTEAEFNKLLAATAAVEVR